MKTPSNLKYTKSDEWFDPSNGAVGITDFAQSQLSDIVFVELLVEEGEEVTAGKAIASVESVKASAEIYAPAPRNEIMCSRTFSLVFAISLKSEAASISVNAGGRSNSGKRCFLGMASKRSSSDLTPTILSIASRSFGEVGI